MKRFWGQFLNLENYAGLFEIILLKFICHKNKNGKYGPKVLLAFSVLLFPKNSTSSGLCGRQLPLPTPWHIPPVSYSLPCFSILIFFHFAWIRFLIVYIYFATRCQFGPNICQGPGFFLLTAWDGGALCFEVLANSQHIPRSKNKSKKG